MNDLDAELLLEGLDDVLLEELLILAAEAVDDQRVVGPLAPHIRSGETCGRGCGCALDEVAPIERVVLDVLVRHVILRFHISSGRSARTVLCSGMRASLALARAAETNDTKPA